MRIAFFTNNYLPRSSGVAHAVENLRLSLEEFGHQVFVFAPRYSKKDKESSKLFRYKSIRTHHKMGFLRAIPFPHSPTIRKKIKGLNLDIIHSHHPYILGKTALKYAKELNIPIVFTLHTPYYRYIESMLGNMGEAVSSLVLEGNINYANKCDIVIVPTKIVKDNLIKAGLTSKSAVLPSGIQLSKFGAMPKKAARKKLQLHPSDKIFLTVGRLTYERNVDFIIESFSLASRKIPKAKLVIVGSGFNKPRLIRMAKSLKLDKKILFAGKLPYRQIPAYYSAADVFLYASIIDTQGLVLCEAMASGLPIIATNQAMGPKSIVKDNKIGFLVKPDINVFSQKMINLATDKAQLRHFSKNAFREAAKYNQQTLAKKLENIYFRLISSQ